MHLEFDRGIPSFAYPNIRCLDCKLYKWPINLQPLLLIKYDTWKDLIVGKAWPYNRKSLHLLSVLFLIAYSWAFYQPRSGMVIMRVEWWDGSGDILVVLASVGVFCPQGFFSNFSEIFEIFLLDSCLEGGLLPMGTSSLRSLIFFENFWIFRLV